MPSRPAGNTPAPAPAPTFFRSPALADSPLASPICPILSATAQLPGGLSLRGPISIVFVP